MSEFIEDGVELEKKHCDESKKTVLLIGDSICVGYRKYVSRFLSDRVNLVYPDENCRNSQYIITSLLSWSGLCDPKKVDVVHFNCGHWDASHWNGDELPLTDEDTYARNLEMIIRLLRRFFPNAEICFASTTPTNPDGSHGRNPRFTADIIRYNSKAQKVCKDCGIAYDDLFSKAVGFDSGMYADYCHFTEQGFEIVGRAVSEFLKTILDD